MWFGGPERLLPWTRPRALGEVADPRHLGRRLRVCGERRGEKAEHQGDLRASREAAMLPLRREILTPQHSLGPDRPSCAMSMEPGGKVDPDVRGARRRLGEPAGDAFRVRGVRTRSLRQCVM